MEDLTIKLEKAGLSAKESLVYITLLKKDQISGGDLAKYLNMDRTHTYNILRNLINKGVASHTTKNKKMFFQAASPENLLNEIRKNEQIVKAIIPNLKALEKEKTESSSASVLEGKAGIRTLVNMILDPKNKNILVYGGTGKSYDVLKYEMPHVARKTASLKMKGRIITSEKLRGHAFTKLPNFKIKYIKEIVPSSTTIFKNKIAITTLEEKPLVILIESKSVAESHRKYFEYLWKAAKE